MANALSFIETNIEDLDADQKIERIKENLNTVLD